MTLCIILLFLGFILILDGLFGFLRKIGIPLPLKFSAPFGFVLVIISLILDTFGGCAL